MATAQPRDMARRVAAAPARRADAVSDWLGALYVIAAGAALYATSLSIPFLFDDHFEIVNNALLTALQPLGDYLTQSRGLTGLTFALNYQWTGLEVWSWHVVNVGVHLLNGALVYALVLRTLRLPSFGTRYAAHDTLLAALVALVFLAHPLQTMAASYIVQRAESLAALFYLLTLCLFVAGAVARPGLPRVLRWSAAVITALLAVASKEIAATVAVSAWLYWWCFRPAPAAAAEPAAASAAGWLRWPVAALLVLVPLAYGLRLSWHYFEPSAQPFNEDLARAWVYVPTAGFLSDVPWWNYLCTQFGVILWYLRLFVLPIGQTFDYGWPLVDSFWRLDVILPLLVLLALAGVALWSRRRYPLATFCIGWFFITLSPSSSIIPLRDAAFEHRMYLPLVGLAWLTVVGGYDLLAWLAARRGIAAAQAWRAGAVAAGVWIAALAGATLARNALLKDPIALAEDSAAKAPWNWRAQYALGEELLRLQRPDEALPYLEAAVKLGPQHGSPRVRLGGLLVQKQRYDEAEEVLLPATEGTEESVRAAAYANLGAAYVGKQDLDSAEEAYKSAWKLKPDWISTRVQLAGIYYRKEFWYLAATHYNAVLKDNPRQLSRIGRAAARANLRAARYLAEVKEQYGAAAGLLRKALAYEPTLVVAQHYLAFVLAQSGDWPRARAEMSRVATARPDDPLVQANLERARAEQPLQAPPIDDAG